MKLALEVYYLGMWLGMLVLLGVACAELGKVLAGMIVGWLWRDER